ncbi:MAG: ybiT [Chlamydiales bacterium]|jgi:ATPase subunit of ABC transporter with duplicated ATPase domains|nr:ybiT [Chlamydiales bacterium]
MITVDRVTKTFGGRILFDDVTVTFNKGARYGLTGPNGAGKSTFLKIVMGMEKADQGSIVLPHRIGMLRQNIEAYQDFMVRDVVVMGNQPLWQALQERDALYDAEMTDEVGMKLGELEGIIAEEDGYVADSDAEILLEGMGVNPDHYEKTMRQIPLDQQFRVLLCQALFGAPDALLLDEPTNHLDMESIGWLENFLKNYKGCLVVVSHDRHFLNAITTHIADIDYETVIVYPGNYDQMLIAKTAVRERSEADAKSRLKKISQLQDFVAKFGAGTRASQVQSRVREIERLQPQDLKKSNIQRPYIRFPMGQVQSGKVVLKGEDLSKGYGDSPVFEHLNLEILRGEKVGVIGNNGRGKTTLLKLLAQVLTPDHGTITPGHQVEIDYFPQNHAEVIDKSLEINAFDWLKQLKSGVYDQEVRSVLGKMLFGGDDAFKPIKSLSGGETARLIIAKMMLLEKNVLILDEPNNHLDLEAVSALAWGIEEYKGTVIVASHDRSLIAQVATRIISFEPNGICIHPGSLDDYLASRPA